MNQGVGEGSPLPPWYCMLVSYGFQPSSQGVRAGVQFSGPDVSASVQPSGPDWSAGAQHNDPGRSAGVHPRWRYWCAPKVEVLVCTQGGGTGVQPNGQGGCAGM